MAQRIPLTNDVRQILTTVLDTQKVKLQVYFLEDYIGDSSNGWYCDLTLISGANNDVTLGEKLLSRQYVGRNIDTGLSGRIYVAPITTPEQDLTSGSPWNITHELVYFTETEVSDGITI